MNFLSWFRQPTTITGIASLLGGASGLLTAAASGGSTTAAVVGAGVFAATHLIVNDNTATDVSNIAQTAVGAATTGEAGLVAAAPTLISETFDLVRDITNTPRTTPSATPAVVAAASGAQAAPAAAAAAG